MKRLIAIAAIALCSTAQAAPGWSPKDAATLYRTSPAIANTRWHVATFDADHGFEYNWENCKAVRDLMQHQPGVTVTFWCEPGRFRP